MTVQPDVHALGELGRWCDTCANETRGCLHAAMDDMLDKEQLQRGGRTSDAVTWAYSDVLHKRLGSTVRNHDRAWFTPPPKAVQPYTAPAPEPEPWYQQFAQGMRELVRT